MKEDRPPSIANAVATVLVVALLAGLAIALSPHVDPSIVGATVMAAMVVFAWRTK